MEKEYVIYVEGYNLDYTGWLTEYVTGTPLGYGDYYNTSFYMNKSMKFKEDDLDKVEDLLKRKASNFRIFEW